MLTIQIHSTGCVVDWLTFVSKAIDALAWPITIAFLVLKFRDRFQDLLGKLTEVTLPGGFSGKFEAPLRKAELLRGQLELDFDGAFEGVVDDAPETDPVALSANPTGVIMGAWNELSLVGFELIKGSDMLTIDRVNAAVGGPAAVFAVLMHGRILPDGEVQLLRELEEIRNKAAHSVRGGPTPDDAERFLSLVHSLKLAWLGRIAAAAPRE